MADWVGVEGKDVVVDGEFGFNVVLDVTARYEEGARRRARGVVTSRFPATWRRNEVVKSFKVHEDSSVPGADKWRIVVFVPSEGLRGVGADRPLDAILDVVNDRVVDPITREIEDMRS